MWIWVSAALRTASLTVFLPTALHRGLVHPVAYTSILELVVSDGIDRLLGRNRLCRVRITSERDA